MKRRTLILGGLALVAIPLSAVAQDGWIQLGVGNVVGNKSQGSIPVPEGTGPLSQLAFRTKGGEVRITEVKVFFAVGQPERIVTHFTAREGAVSTPPIRLRSRNSQITTVHFGYRRSGPAPGKPDSVTLELLGRR